MATKEAEQKVEDEDSSSTTTNSNSELNEHDANSNKKKNKNSSSNNKNNKINNSCPIAASVIASHDEMFAKWKKDNQKKEREAKLLYQSYTYSSNSDYGFTTTNTPAAVAAAAAHSNNNNNNTKQVMPVEIPPTLERPSADKELEEIRQTGLAKSLGKQFTEYEKSSAEGMAAYEAEQKDLERRKAQTSEYRFNPNSTADIVSPHEALIMAQTRQKKENQQKERETKLQYQRYSHGGSSDRDFVIATAAAAGPVNIDSPIKKIPIPPTVDRVTADKELEEVRQTGVTKALSKQFIEYEKMSAQDKIEYEAAVRDLENRKAKTSEYKFTPTAGISPHEQLIMSQTKWKKENQKKERETILQYQRHSSSKASSSNNIYAPNDESQSTSSSQNVGVDVMIPPTVERVSEHKQLEEFRQKGLATELRQQFKEYEQMSAEDKAAYEAAVRDLEERKAKTSEYKFNPTAAVISPHEELIMSQTKQKKENQKKERETKLQNQRHSLCSSVVESPHEQVFLSQAKMKKENQIKERETKLQNQRHSLCSSTDSPHEQLFLSQAKMKKENQKKERETMQQYQRHSHCSGSDFVSLQINAGNQTKSSQDTPEVIIPPTVERVPENKQLEEFRQTGLAKELRQQFKEYEKMSVEEQAIYDADMKDLENRKSKTSEYKFMPTSSITSQEELVMSQTKLKKENQKKERETMLQYQRPSISSSHDSPHEQVFLSQAKLKKENQMKERETKLQYQRPSLCSTTDSPHEQVFLSQGKMKKENQMKERETKLQNQRPSLYSNADSPHEQVFLSQAKLKKENQQKERETKLQYQRPSLCSTTDSPHEQVFLSQAKLKKENQQKERETKLQYQRHSHSIDNDFVSLSVNVGKQTRPIENVTQVPVPPTIDRIPEDKILEEVRQTGITKILGQQFKEYEKMSAEDRLLYDAEMQDLEDRKAKTSEYKFKPTGDISPRDALFMAQTKWKKENQKRERETKLQYQHHSHSIGSDFVANKISGGSKNKPSKDNYNIRVPPPTNNRKAVEKELEEVRQIARELSEQYAVNEGLVNEDSSEIDNYAINGEQVNLKLAHHAWTVPITLSENPINSNEKSMSTIPGIEKNSSDSVTIEKSVEVDDHADENVQIASESGQGSAINTLALALALGNAEELSSKDNLTILALALGLAEKEKSREKNEKKGQPRRKETKEEEPLVEVTQTQESEHKLDPGHNELKTKPNIAMDKDTQSNESVGSEDKENNMLEKVIDSTQEETVSLRDESVQPITKNENCAAKNEEIKKEEQPQSYCCADMMDLVKPCLNTEDDIMKVDCVEISTAVFQEKPSEDCQSSVIDESEVSASQKGEEGPVIDIAESTSTEYETSKDVSVVSQTSLKKKKKKKKKLIPGFIKKLTKKS